MLQDEVKTWLNVPTEVPVIVESTEPAKELTAHLLFLCKYEAEKKQYQKALDKVYRGTVRPIERFINQNAIFLHHCSECNKVWFSKPIWLLTRANQEHVCGVDTSRINPKKVKKKLTEDDKKKMYSMAEQGLSITKNTNHFGISRPTVISHLRKAGLK